MPESHPLLPTLDPFDPQLALTMSQAAQRLRGRTRRRVSRGQAYRWATRGVPCKAYGGPTLKLPSERMGSSLYVMPQWCTAFEQARIAMGRHVTEARLPADPEPRPRTARQASLGHLRAVASLEKMGLKCGP